MQSPKGPCYGEILINVFFDTLRAIIGGYRSAHKVLDALEGYFEIRHQRYRRVKRLRELQGSSNLLLMAIFRPILDPGIIQNSDRTFRIENR